MKITFRATGEAERSTDLQVIDADTILIDGTSYRIPQDQPITDAQGPINSGYRDLDGTLHLVIHGVYCDSDAHLWETAPHRGTYEEVFEHTNADLTGITVVITTGKTQADLDAKAKVDKISALKAELAALDLVIPRSTEDLYAATGMKPYATVADTINKKNALRAIIKEMEA